MQDLSTSFVLLVIALVLLWLAVTDKLSRLLDAVDVVRGKRVTTETAASTVSSVAMGTRTPLQVSFPALPTLGIMES